MKENHGSMNLTDEDRICLVKHLINKLNIPKFSIGYDKDLERQYLKADGFHDIMWLKSPVLNQGLYNFFLFRACEYLNYTTIASPIIIVGTENEWYSIYESDKIWYKTSDIAREIRLFTRMQEGAL